MTATQYLIPQVDVDIWMLQQCREDTVIAKVSCKQQGVDELLSLFILIPAKKNTFGTNSINKKSYSIIKSSVSGILQTKICSSTSSFLFSNKDSTPAKSLLCVACSSMRISNTLNTSTTRSQPLATARSNALCPF